MQNNKNTTFTIPEPVSRVTKGLEKSGFEAYVVGGCVRDLIIGKVPKDWDITTNATPEQIMAIFPDSFYENTFGTVGVKNDVSDETLKVIEVTPYRIEGKYTDKRRPDEVVFSQNIEDDLKRRDFTINALAFRPNCEVSPETHPKIIDMFGGLEDLKRGIIRAVGEPQERFAEDALRMMRAIRLSAELGFMLDMNTAKAIKDNSKNIKDIAVERVRDELIRVINSKYPMDAIIMMKNLGLLEHTVPELLDGFRCGQNHHHKYDVFEHLVRSLQHSADKGYIFDVRLASLLHDIGKPNTKRVSPETGEATFYGHEVVGARIAKKILERLKFPTKTTEKVVKLIRWHMFFSDTENITLSAVRRIINNVSRENIWDLIDLRICDRIGSGSVREDPYRLRKYQSMIEEALRDPISVGMLKIDGNSLMNELKMTPGPKIGFILNALLEEVLEDPKLNNLEYLIERAKILEKLDLEELKKLGKSGMKKREEEEERELVEIRGKYKVK